MSRASVLAQNDQEVQDYILAFKQRPYGPLAPPLSNDDALASTAFVKRAMGSYSTQINYPGDVVLTATSVGQLTGITSAGVVTLPEAATVPPGSLITIIATYGCTVKTKPGTTDVLSTVTGPTATLTLPPQATAVFRRLVTGEGWNLDGGDAALKYSPMFAALLADFGWKKSSSGIVMQWGMGTANAAGTASVTFPTKFPNACLRVFTTPRNNAAYNATASVGGYTSQGATFYTTLAPSGQAGAAQQLSFEWLAIGW